MLPKSDTPKWKVVVNERICLLPTRVRGPVCAYHSTEFMPCANQYHCPHWRSADAPSHAALLWSERKLGKLTESLHPQGCRRVKIPDVTNNNAGGADALTVPVRHCVGAKTVDASDWGHPSASGTCGPLPPHSPETLRAASDRIQPSTL